MKRIALILLCALLLSACATPTLGEPVTQTGFAMQQGPCGLELVLTASGGVPVQTRLPAPLDGQELILEADGGAVLRWRNACPKPPAPPDATR
jgi:predicted small secreted protein